MLTVVMKLSEELRERKTREFTGNRFGFEASASGFPSLRIFFGGAGDERRLPTAARLPLFFFFFFDIVTTFSASTRKTQWGKDASDFVVRGEMILLRLSFAAHSM